MVETVPAAVAPMAPAVTAAPAPWYNMVKLELLGDTYYQYNFTASDNATAPALRNFDTLSNTFALNYAKIGLQMDSDPVSFRLDLGYGQMGTAIATTFGSGFTSVDPELAAATPSPSGIPGGTFIVQQAFASLKLGMLTLDVGRFVTTAGAEVIEANKNWLYSRSMLFFIIPLLHTGARANVKINDQVSFQLSLVNGINVDPDNNKPKTVGASVTVLPVSTTSVVATAYVGKEGPQGATGPTRITTDLVVAHNISDQFGLNLNVDYIKLDTANAVGASLMGRFVAAEHLVLAARGEFVKDKGIMTGLDTSLYEGTVMAGFPFGGGKFEARTEVRADFAADPVFNGEDNQVTGTVAVLGSM